MNNTLHTPAPWYIAHHSDINGGQSIDIRHCCDIPPSTPEIHQIARLPKNALANAHLISAAPDLLSALEEMMSVFQDHEQYDEESAEVIQSSRAAIRKAKGEA
jgi:hypothetical protein